MSIHPSLKGSSQNQKYQSVLKRLHRILFLKKKDQWQDGDSVFSLPKVKIVKFKIKKVKGKEAKEEEAAAVAGQPTPSAGAEKKPEAAEKPKK